MKQTSKSVLIGAVIGVVAVLLFACPGGILGLVYRMQLGSMIMSLDTSIHFYGKVVDQNGDPVEGARVAVGIRRFSLFSPYFMGSKNLKAVTDREGHFNVWEWRGSQLFIGEISREGYEFRYEDNRNNSFDYSVPGGADMVLEGPSPVFNPDKNNPVIYRLRKKLQNRTFLFEKPSSGIQVLAKESGILMGWDFIEGKRSRMSGDESRDIRSENCDLFYRATYDEETGDWNVVLKPGGPNGGIFVSDQMLYVAPEDGFQPELSFVPEDRGMPDGEYFYLKTRSPSIFSRFEITHVTAFENFFRMDAKVATNPYGDRVLDSVDLDSLTNHQHFVLEKRLIAEARAMLGDGRLPPRPKIMALIEAVKRGDKRLEDLERETNEWKTEKNPNYTHQYWKRAREKMERRDFEGAIEEWNEYLRRVGTPSHYLVYSYKGAALEHIGDFEGALECYRTGMEEFPERTFDFGPKMVRIRKKMGDYEGALVDLEEYYRLENERKTQKLKDVEKELALLKERPDTKRYLKLYPEKVDLIRSLEYWDSKYRDERTRLEEMLRNGEG